jgi:hypothetical protein
MSFIVDSWCVMYLVVVILIKFIITKHYSHNIFSSSSFDMESSVTKKIGTRQQPDSSDSTALLVTDLALSIHTSTEHAQQLSLTQTHLSLLQAQTLHRAPRMEFHNSYSHKKSPPTQTSKLLEHRTKV